MTGDTKLVRRFLVAVSNDNEGDLEKGVIIDEIPVIVMSHTDDRDYEDNDYAVVIEMSEFEMFGPQTLMHGECCKMIVAAVKRHWEEYLANL